MYQVLLFKSRRHLCKGSIGPLKQYLAEMISLQRSNCNILGRTGTVALFANEARFFRFRVLSKTKSTTPIFFAFLAKVDHFVYAGQVLKISVRRNILDANVLKSRSSYF